MYLSVKNVNCENKKDLKNLNYVSLVYSLAPFTYFIFHISGNSSQVSDGAAAVLVAKRSAARQHGLPVLGIFRAFAVAGVPPDIMGIGPAAAIPEALKKAGK